jgi:hypothetical protein
MVRRTSGSRSIAENVCSGIGPHNENGIAISLHEQVKRAKQYCVVFAGIVKQAPRSVVGYLEGPQASMD